MSTESLADRLEAIADELSPQAKGVKSGVVVETLRDAAAALRDFEQGHAELLRRIELAERALDGQIPPPIGESDE